MMTHSPYVPPSSTAPDAEPVVPLAAGEPVSGQAPTHRRPRRWLLPVLGLALTGLLTGCTQPQAKMDCSQAIPALDYGQFTISERGFALHPKTSVEWFRCNAGERFQNRRCTGDALLLTLDEALAYAEEFSRSTPGQWRLPTVREMRTIQERQCHNPSMNPNVFPSVLVNNYWTMTPSRWGAQVGCSVYTLRGNTTCRLARNLERPFLLVRDL